LFRGATINLIPRQQRFLSVPGTHRLKDGDTQADVQSMTEDELIERIRERSTDPHRATSAAGWSGNHWIHAQSFPPAHPNVVREAQERFGFPLPTLLVRLWSEVANGGVGPGYGIYGLEGGLPDDGLDLPLPDLYLEYRDDSTWTELIGEESASRAFPICDWGCCSGSVLDCSTPEGNLILITDKQERIDQGVSFKRWMEDWLDGIRIGADNYRPAAK
jgi:hypothetical protein